MQIYMCTDGISTNLYVYKGTPAITFPHLALIPTPCYICNEHRSTSIWEENDPTLIKAVNQYDVQRWTPDKRVSHYMAMAGSWCLSSWHNKHKLHFHDCTSWGWHKETHMLHWRSLSDLQDVVVLMGFRLTDFLSFYQHHMNGGLHVTTC